MSLRVQDRLRYFVARAISRLPDAVKIRLSGEAPVIVDGQQLDPQVQLLRAVRRKLGVHGLLEPSIERGRARYRHETNNFRGPMTKVAAVRDFTIGSLRVRHYSPGVRNAPLTVYLHGGGFTIGDLDTHDEPCRILCHHGDTHVLSIDYRLAPEHPFPAALEDTAVALAWAQENAASLGADPDRVGIGGDSAGANLATVVARLTSRKPAAQLLFYPPTDGTARPPSYDFFGEGFFLSCADRDGFGRAYAAPGPDSRASPLLAPDLAVLPAALLITAGFDILRDEGEAYAEALRLAGVAVQSRRYPGLGHGFIHLTGVCTTARDAVREIAREWGAFLRAQGAGGGEGIRPVSL
jgi:acetyl esterase